MTTNLNIMRQTNAVMNIGHFLTQAARRLKDAPALIRAGDVRSWQQVNARVDAIAYALTDMGVKKGDRVLLHSNNCLDMAEAMYAVFKTGAVLVPTNFRLNATEIAQMAEISGATYFIGNHDFPDHIAALSDLSQMQSEPIIIGGNYEALVADKMKHGVFNEAPVDYNDPAWFFFTSGTTGTPKCAVLTHGQLGFVLTNHAADLMPGLSPQDASLVVAPLSHGAGLHYFVQVARGAKTVLTETDGLDPHELWQLVERHQITNMFTVPTIVKRLVEHPSVDVFDHSSLKHVIYAGAPMYREDQKTALKKLGPVLVQYFGLGEVTGAITILPASEHYLDDTQMRVGTCGFARTGMQIAILDDEANELPLGKTGAIGVRGPAVFSGYYNNQKANDESFQNGWFLTGDIGHMDDAGYVYLTGRKSDMYISGGSNIYPREIEEKLLEHPAIAEIAIVGIPDADWGEVGAAVIVLKDAATVTETELRSWFNDKIARYKQPKLIVFRDELPKSGYGKIEKRRVRELLLADGLIKEIA